MKQRREAVELTKEIYTFLKKNKSKKHSINSISKKMKAKYEITIKCLNLLKFLNLVKEKKGSSKPIPERFFSIKTNS